MDPGSSTSGIVDVSSYAVNEYCGFFRFFRFFIFSRLDADEGMMFLVNQGTSEWDCMGRI